MEPAQTATEAKTWVDFAFQVWHDVWGYVVSTGLGLALGSLLPQWRPFRKPEAKP